MTRRSNTCGRAESSQIWHGVAWEKVGLCEQDDVSIVKEIMARRYRSMRRAMQVPQQDIKGFAAPVSLALIGDAINEEDSPAPLDSGSVVLFVLLEDRPQSIHFGLLQMGELLLQAKGRPSQLGPGPS